MALREFESVRIIETLRSGVSSQELSAIFSYGREALLETVQSDLETVAATKDTRALILRGDYGEGKTHFLNTVFNVAQKLNFAVSLVILSKETPFNRLNRVYPKVTCETYLPGEMEPGLEILLRDIHPDSVAAEQLLGFTRTELHPKITCVLENYFRAPESSHVHLLYRDLMGDWLPLAQLQALHRLNFAKPVKIQTFKPQIHVWDYFRLLSHLIRARGFRGWAILFDEFELVGTLDIAARSEAYYNMGRFLFPQDTPSLEATYVIFSTFSGFWSVRLLAERHPDTEEAPARHLAKGEPQKAEMSRRTLNALLQNTVNLESLPTAEVKRMLEAVRDFHAKAYGWQPDIDLTRLMDATKRNRLRTIIRYALEYLDLQYLYREEPEICTGTLNEVSMNDVAAMGKD